MNLIQNPERFRFSIRQPPSCNWCIPASIEVVTKYHRPSSGKDQYGIAMMFHGKGLELGLNNVEAALKGNFDWMNIRYEDTLRKFNDLAKKIEECVTNSTPPIISIPGRTEGEGSVAYARTRWVRPNYYLRLYNPDPNMIGDYCDVKRTVIEDTDCRERKSLQRILLQICS